VAYVSDGADQSLLCEVVTDEAVKFINKHRHDLPRLREFMGLEDLLLGQTTARPPIRGRTRTATTRSAKDAPNVLFIAIDDMND
jgi:hypothetical protein